MPGRSLVLIDAPSPLGLRPPRPGVVPGVRGMPRALHAAGLDEALRPARITALPEPPYSAEIDPASGIRNLRGIERFTRALADEVAAALARGEWPLVLGGDCSVLLGPALALARRGPARLLHLDGHNDFGHEGNFGRPYASVAGGELAVLTGRGDAALTGLAGARPLVREEDILQLGEKAEPGMADWLADFAASAITRVSASEIRRDGPAAAVARALAWLERSAGTDCWLHLDLDVLDPQWLPAVDSPDPGGLDWTELHALLGPLAAHPQVCGMDVTIYDPELDPENRYAPKIVQLLGDVLRPST